METYNKSILKYRDVRSAVELAQERYFEKGIEQGIKTTAVKFFEKGIPIELVCQVTGLSPEQIKQIR